MINELCTLYCANKTCSYAMAVSLEFTGAVTITQAFSQQPVPAWGNYANGRYADSIKAQDEQATSAGTQTVPAAQVGMPLLAA